MVRGGRVLTAVGAMVGWGDDTIARLSAMVMAVGALIVL
jgi:hypothetical protein